MRSSLNGVSLVLIVAAVGFTAPMGLAVCGAVSVVEAAISILGQYVACLLLGTRLREVAAALIPGLSTTAVCAAATVAGKLAGAALNIHPPLVLAFVVAPLMVAFCWLQADDVQGLVRRGFGGCSRGIVDVAET